MIGESLGPYNILEPLGAGGMGEVYLGEDTRLGRKVAIKVLPAEFASDPERLARFEQEARAAAALNHPHIAVVHDIGFQEGSAGTPGAGDEAASAGTGADDATDTDLVAAAGLPAAGVHYMVQEYLEGEPLRAPLERGALPLKKALAFATEVAEALAAAHAAGIVHRDLKPDNVFITKEGHAKVLDFGLAKLTEAARPVDASMSPTMLGTVAGQVVGTAGYMAPEQVRGDEAIDGRADLFALGCLLYEMVTGQRAFSGDNIHDVLNKILSQQPQPAAQANPETPPRLEWIIEKALAKEREERYQTAGDAVVDLKGAAGAGSTVSATAATAPAAATDSASTAAERSSVSPVVAAAVAGATLVIGLGLGRTFLASPIDVAPEVVRFSLGISETGAYNGTNNRVIAVTPDGRTIGVNATDGIWVRHIGEATGTILEGTLLAREPFFSPDSRQVGFFENGRVRWLAIDGSSPIADGPEVQRPLGTTWGDDGFIYVGQGTNGIVRVDPAGGDAVQVATVEAPQLAQGPEVLPGGEWLLFTIASGMSGWDDARIVAHSLVTGDRVDLGVRGREPRYAPSGHLLFVRQGVLYAAPFDSAAPAVTGAPVPVADPVQVSNFDFTGAAYYDVSDTGTLVYVRPGGSRNLRLTWIDAEMRQVQLPIAPEPFGMYRLSPNQQQIAAEVWDRSLGTQISVFDLDRPGESRITTEGVNRNPVWSGDGETVYFGSDRRGDFDIWSQRTDMSEPAQLVYAAPGDQVPAGVAEDGSLMVMVQLSPINADIWLLPLGNGGEPTPFVSTPIDETNVQLSPDGRLIVYQAHENNTDWTIYVSELATTRRHTIGEGWFPGWSADGSRLFFSYLNGLGFVDVSSLDPFETGEFRNFPITAAMLPSNNMANIASTDDGRILIPLPSGADIDQTDTVAVTVNWFEELRQRVPTGR